MTGLSTKVRRQVADRDRGYCLRCGAPGTNVHHRQAKGMGGSNRPWTDRPDNLVTVCGQGNTSGCHKWISDEYTDAERLGWVIRRSSTEIPSEVPVVDVLGRRYFLTEEGNHVFAGYTAEIPGSAA